MKQDILTPPRNLTYLFSNWTGKTIANHIKTRFNKIISPRAAISLMHQLGLTLLRPQTIPAKGSPEKKAEFRETFDKTIQILEPNDHVLFLDAATFQHSASITRIWAEKGHQPTVPIVGGRERMHILGAIEPANDIGWFSTCPTLKASCLISFFKQLMRQYPIGDLYIVLDNARVHHAKLVQRFIEINNRIHLIYLPPYSPDLNPIEKFWKFVRQQITHNTYYPKFDDFQTTIVDFLSSFKHPQGVIRNLCNMYRISCQMSIATAAV